MTTKIVGFFTTAWNHKKKIIFFGGLGSWGISYLNTLNNEQKIRTEYAKRAALVGRQLVPVDYKPQRVLVFVDRSDPDRIKSLSNFTKNVLPLLNLAGLDVTVQNAETVEELNQLSESADVRNCTGVCVIGSAEFSLPAVLNGLFVNGSDKARSAVALFTVDEDVEALVKKAMRIVNNVKAPAHVYQTTIYPETEEHQPKKDYRLADLRFGWLDYVWERKAKFWIFGGLRDRVAPLWYFTKFFPEPVPFVIRWTHHCSGCRKCVTEAPKTTAEQQSTTRWWQGWVGRPKEQPGDLRRRQYAHILNPDCGRAEERQFTATDISIRNLDEGVYGRLDVHHIPAFESRFAALRRVWADLDDRVRQNPAVWLSSSQSVPTQTVDVQWSGDLPEIVNESNSVVRLKGKPLEEAKLRRIVIESGPKTVDMF